MTDIVTENTILGIAALGVARAPQKLITLGLGSCVGLVLYDPAMRIGGMAHIMLPQSPANSPAGSRGKYADTAFEDLLAAMLAAGAGRYRLAAKLAGGAHMFMTATNNDMLKVGQRNIEACHRLLSGRNIPIMGEDTGGNVGRTIELDCATGALLIRTALPRTEKTI